MGYAISYNPIDGLTLPKQSKQEKFKGTAYTVDQAKKLLAVIEGNELIYPAIILGLCYGLRKSKVLGLRWCDIDFDTNDMRIRNTVVRMKTPIEHEMTKSAASKRTLKLVPGTKNYLQQLHKEQMDRALLFRKEYKTTNHVCVWPDGRPFSPNLISSRFKMLLNRHDFPIIRFHDLRHTAGSLLISQGMSIKQVQEFLGHEQASTTLDIYTHIDNQAKIETANAMGKALNLEMF